MSKNNLTQDQKSQLTDKLMDAVIEAAMPQIGAMVEQRISALRATKENKSALNVPTADEIAATILEVVPSSKLHMTLALEIAEHLKENYVIMKRADQKTDNGRK